MKPARDDILSCRALENRTREEQLTLLCNAIRDEHQKPLQEQDAELIDFCLDRIDKLQAEILPYTEEATAIRLAAFRKKRPSAPRRTKTATRIAVILAACFLLLFFSLTAAAATLGYSSVIAWFEESLFSPEARPADELPANRILYTKGEEMALYTSISELWEVQELPILYPARLPGAAKLQTLTEEIGADGERIWHFGFTNDHITLRVSSHPTSTEPSDDFALYKTGLADFRFMKEDDGSGYGMAVIDGYEYLFYAENYRDLFFIFDHISTPNS